MQWNGFHGMVAMEWLQWFNVEQARIARRTHRMVRMEQRQRMVERTMRPVITSVLMVRWCLKKA